VEGVRASIEATAVQATNPWGSGLFYLAIAVLLALLLVLVAILLHASGWLTFLILIVGLVLLVPTIGALVMRQNSLLSERSFVDLMSETYRALPAAIRSFTGPRATA
jgi:hypothetical protein